MATDLIQWCKKASSLLPHMTEDDDSYEFTGEMFPDLSENVEFSDFAIRHGTHEYMDTFRVDYLQISATKEAYRALGFAILASAFQAKDIWITLTSERTEYRFLSVSSTNMLSFARSISKVSLKQFIYSPRQRSRHPFLKTDWLSFQRLC